MSEAQHPGTIVFEDEVRGTSEEKDASSVPETVAFAEVDGELVPVVKVVMSQQGDEIAIRSYGADGALLTSTIGYGTPA